MRRTGKGYYKGKNGKYWIGKTINGKRQYYGTVATEEEAKKVVQSLRECNYDRELLPEDIKELLNSTKGYTKVHNKYQINKIINGERITYGYTNNEDDAKKVVSALRECDYNIDLLSSDIKELMNAPRKNASKGYGKTRDKYRVYRLVNGKQENFGIVETEEDAKIVVQALRECNYDMDSLPEDIKNLFYKSNYGKGYTEYNGKYYIQKRINGKTKHFGVAYTEEKAKKIVAALRECNYNMSLLSDDIKKLIGA